MSNINSDLSLISHVKKYPELYNYNHPLYVDAVRRGECWSEIATSLNSEDSVCKLRWYRLRDNFRKATNTRKQREISNPKGRKKRRLIKYSEELNFLTPFFQSSADPDPESDCSTVQEHVHVVTSKENLSSADENTSEEVKNNRQNTVLFNDIKLIENVEKHEELYNPVKSLHDNQVRWDAIWKEIGIAVGFEAATCKDRWSNLKDKYRKAISKRLYLKRLGYTNLKPITYDKEMKFLLPYLNIEDKDQSEGESQEDLEDSVKDEPLYEDSSYSVQNSENDEQNLLVDKIPTKRRRLSISIEPNISSNEPNITSMEPYVSSIESNSSFQYLNNDLLTDFFLTMAKTTKTFPIEEQLRIKMELFHLVNNTELQLLKKRNGT